MSCGYFCISNNALILHLTELHGIYGIHVRGFLIIGLSFSHLPIHSLSHQILSHDKTLIDT